MKIEDKLQTEGLRHSFTDSLPTDLEEGVVYVSVNYAVAIHLCLSGCGSQVVTPLHPRAWELTFNGVAVSLFPSIGNYQLPCQAHYWIRNNRVQWVPSVTPTRFRPAHRVATIWKALQRFFSRTR